MTEEDDEFNRIEREAKQRMEAVSAALDKKAENARELGLDYEPAPQEPVGVFREDDDIGHVDLIPHQQMKLKDGDKLYTSPPAQRTWVGLTDEEVDECFEFIIEDSTQAVRFYRAIEDKLKEKNT